MKTLSQPLSGITEQHQLLATPRLDRILVATDLSSLSISGIEAALSLLKGNPNASLTLVHVIEPLPATEFMEVGTLASIGIEDLKKSGEDSLARLRLNYGEGIEFTTKVLVGNPIWVISEMVANGEFDLIAMTSHGRSGFKRLFLGSVAEGVIHRAHCPVLVVKLPQDVDREFIPDAREITWKRILVGYDHRPGSVAALGMAEKVCERSNGAITLMEVLPPPDKRLALNVLHEERDDSAAIGGALDKLEEVRMSYSPLSAEWDIAAGIGEPWDILAEKASEISASLVVVGPHHHTLRAHDFIGSTAQRLVRMSPCSILAVKYGAETTNQE